MAEWGVWRAEVEGRTHEVVLRLQRWSGLVQLWVDGAPRVARHISYSFDHPLMLGEQQATASVLYGRGPALRFDLAGKRLPPVQRTAPANAAALLANAPQPAPYPKPNWQDQAPLWLGWLVFQTSEFDALIALALGGLTALLATKVFELKGHPLVPALCVSWGYHGWLIAIALLHPNAWWLFLLGIVGMCLFPWLLPAPKGLWQVAIVVAWSCLSVALFFALLNMGDRRAWKTAMFTLLTNVMMTFLLVRGVRKLRAAPPQPALS